MNKQNDDSKDSSRKLIILKTINIFLKDFVFVFYGILIFWTFISGNSILSIILVNILAFWLLLDTYDTYHKEKGNGKYEKHMLQEDNVFLFYLCLDILRVETL